MSIATQELVNFVLSTRKLSLLGFDHFCEIWWKFLCSGTLTSRAVSETLWLLRNLYGLLP